jgi:two-component system, OmpR family, copper resistance phosphate regulon response regulator CusR
MRLLVVEDEKKTVEFLRKGLMENGYSVDTAFDGEAGLQLALNGNHDVLVLDINLPGRDGWSILGEFRKADHETPVLFLTAREQVSDRVKGLELGADDYLVKPFSFKELLARLHTITRRGRGGRHSAVLNVADMVVDPISREAWRAGIRLNLSPQDFSLLLLFAQKQGEVLSRGEILDKAWGMKFEPKTNVVDVAVWRLRSRVDKEHQRPLIHTIRGVGYIMKVPK